MEVLVKRLNFKEVFVNLLMTLDALANMVLVIMRVISMSSP